jgi:hypothetical protein
MVDESAKHKEDEVGHESQVFGRLYSFLDVLEPLHC